MIVPPIVPTSLESASEVEGLWLVSVDRYHEMIRLGILTEDDPVELLEGLLVRKIPKSPLHRVVCRLLRQALESLVPPGWHMESQEPITLATSEPEPDLAVLRGTPTDYSARHPRAEKVGLLIEVADATLEQDRGPKARLYAAAGIPCCWIVDLKNRTVLVLSEPAVSEGRPTYGRTAVYGWNEEIPVVIQGNRLGSLVNRDLFPPEVANGN